MKKFLAALMMLAAGASASMIGMDALGQEQIAGGQAASAGRGYAGGAKTGEAEGTHLLNPARQAFDSKVVFNANFLMEFLALEKNDVSYSTNQISLPSFNLSFPLKEWGTLGVSLWQRYSSQLREEVDDSKTSTYAKIEYQGSVYEVIPSYAFRFPFLRNFALGASAHVLMGNVERKLTLGPNNNEVADDDVWASKNRKLTDHVDGSWEIENHPAYYTLSLQYRGRQSSFFFSYTTPHTLLNKLSYNYQFSQLDTLEPTHHDRRIEIPAMMATGVNYRIRRHNIMADLQWKTFDEDMENIGQSYNLKPMTETQNDFMASLGYQRDGSTLYYDPYWDRITYRLGGWYKNWYIKDVYEFGASIGAGFPLGRKGTMIDLAIQGGRRMSESDRTWDETFVGIRLGLMGIAQWGQNRF